MKKLYLLLGILVFSLAVTQLATPSVVQANAGNCYAYASKGCISNVSYWYDSCGAIQAVYQNCNNTNQLCSGGVCVGNNNIRTYPTNYPVQTYIKNYRTACYNNNIFWYDSNSVVQGVYKSCSDSNSCTVDSCGSSKCSNVLKCDGSTCGVNSADYMTYCVSSGQATTQNTQNTSTTTTTINNNGNNGQVVGQVAGSETSSGGLAVIMFAAKQSTPTQWSKSLDTANGDNVNFIIIFKNTSPASAPDVTVQANLTNNIAYTGNLKIDNNTSAGSIVSGIDVGTLAPETSKAISFTGTVQSQNLQTIQVSSNVSSGSMHDSDYLTINVPGASAGTAAVSGSNGFVDFVKKWYLWALIILVLIILFVIIFRRLSTSA